MSSLGKRKMAFKSSPGSFASKRPRIAASKKKVSPNKYRLTLRQGNDLPEYKFCDTAFNGSSVSGTGVTALVESIAQGSDYTDRIGRKVTIKAVQYSVVYDASPAYQAAGVPNYGPFRQGRFMVVWDKQPNSALAGSGDILETTGNASAPMSAKDVSNIDRFTILADEVFTCGHAGPVALGAERYIRCDLETRFDGTGNTIADISSGAMLVLYLDNNNSGSLISTLTGRVRLYFTDD